MPDLRTSLGVVRFGEFEADFKAAELRKHGSKIKLQEQPLGVLRILLERAGEIVTREELQKQIWPSDTFVDFDHGLYNAIKRLREALGDDAEQPQYIETVPRRGYRFIAKPEQQAALTPNIQSLVVLPLENLSRDPEQEYFAEGLTEALITTLAKIGALRVVSRTTAMQYKGTHKSLPEIGRELNVDAVIEGTVLRVGDRVRISAQMIDARADAHLWAESYDRDLRDVLALHAELAHAIAGEIRVKLTAMDQAHFARIHQVNPEAYDAYLKGLYWWNRRPPTLLEAIKCFEEAIAKDPTYVPAYAYLADCKTSLGALALAPADQGCIPAKALALKALQMDSTSAEAHVSLAFASVYHYDFLTAQKELERAIELDPRNAYAHYRFGWFVAQMGHYEEAYTELQRAIRLDPLVPLPKAILGYNCIYARRYDQAIAHLTSVVREDPQSGVIHGGLGWAYRCKGLYEPAITSFQTAIDHQLWRGSTLIAWLGEVYAAGGYREEAEKTLAQLSEMSKTQYVSPYGIARMYNTLGNQDEALNWLEKAYQQQAEWMLLLKVDHCFDDLRSHRRFQDIQCRMNFLE